MEGTLYFHLMVILLQAFTAGTFNFYMTGNLSGAQVNHLKISHLFILITFFCYFG